MVSTFVAGLSYEILPLRIYSMVRVGLKPEVNAIGTILLAASLVLVIVSSRNYYYADANTTLIYE